MIELAVFDMAGTTVDDGGLVYEALRQAVEETGASVAQEDLQRWMGTDKVTAITELMRLGGVEPTDGVPAAQFERFKAILAESYREHPPVEIGGAGEMLRELRSRGIKVALTTGFDEDVVRPLLAGLNWAVADGSNDAGGGAGSAGDPDVLLDAVVTTDDVPAGRPAPYMVQRAMERTGVIHADRVLVAGDTAVDVQAGRNCGAIACGVLTGGASRDVLERERPDHLLGSVAQVPDLPEVRLGTADAAVPATADADPSLIPDNDYLLLTPGPLSTTKGVRAALLRDWCTWDDSYNELTQRVRRGLVDLAGGGPEHTAVLMQGSGTFVVESVVGTLLGDRDPAAAPGRLLVLANGAYGRRIAQIAAGLAVDHEVLDAGNLAPVDVAAAGRLLAEEPSFTHVAMVHCETTTGVLNPLEEFAAMARERGVVSIVDAMSSFGGVPIDVAALGIDVLISSANKCIQGVPGFGFVVARRDALVAAAGRSRSLSLDLHAQWAAMEEGGGKWRFTSPTHVVHAFERALTELAEEGGVAARHERYASNQRTLIRRFEELGLRAVIDPAHQSPIITAFAYPSAEFDFPALYDALKAAGFVIYPGKVTELDTFRIGTIGDVHPADIDRLADAVAAHRRW